MGTKNGTWLPRYQSFDDHGKTARLCVALVALKVPEAFAQDVAFGQWSRLAFWLLTNGGDGLLGAMTPRSFAHIVRWDDQRTAKALWDAWMQSGFIDEPGTENARLHDFRDAFAHMLGARERAARKREQMHGQFADSSRTVREPCENGSPSRAYASAPLRSAPNQEDSPYPLADVEQAEEIANQWGRLCGHLPQPVRPLPPDLLSAVASAARAEPGRDWGATFERVARSDFLSGRGRSGWRANLGWVVANLAKIDGGNYDGGSAPPRRANDLAASAAAASQILDAAFGDAP